MLRLVSFLFNSNFILNISYVYMSLFFLVYFYCFGYLTFYLKVKMKHLLTLAVILNGSQEVMDKILNKWEQSI